jgi:glycosyltransferase involved in cell wall biosynthesis
MHLVDTLEIGGTEKVAVNLVNRLPQNRFDITLCSTRRDGPLVSLVDDGVKHLSLRRRHRFDSAAIRRLSSYVAQNDVRILHAHGTSLFLARLVSMFAPFPRVIWHDHYGRQELHERPVWLYRLATRGVDAVLSVNGGLADWARKRLGVKPDRVWYVPHFVPFQRSAGHMPELPGLPGKRLACVASLRPEKGHRTLLHAMEMVHRRCPTAHLLLIGNAPDREYLRHIDRLVDQRNLRHNVTWLSDCQDVPAILKACDVGVLSSVSEGLPLALLEYGMAGLSTVATAVGQCPEVLDGGRAGILVPPSSPESLAEAILFLLESPQKRATIGARLDRYVREVFDADAITRQICSIYDAVTS